MKLSDIVSGLHLSFFAEVPLLIFFGVFLGVMLHVFRQRSEFEDARLLPLREPWREPSRPKSQGESR